MITDSQRSEASLAILKYLIGLGLPDMPLAHAAANWLSVGADTPGIVALAGLSERASEWEVRDSALAVLDEFEVPRPDEPNQFDALAAYLVRSLLDNPNREEEYSKLLWLLAEQHYDSSRIEDLDELIGLASSWDEPYADQLAGALKDAATRYLQGRP